MIRKITAGLALVLSAFVADSFASQVAVCSTNGPSAPCYNGGFTFGLAGFYANPFSDPFSYVEIHSDLPKPSNTLKSIDPSYDWGYRVNVGYIFPCTNSDISLTYTNYRNTKAVNETYNHSEVFGAPPFAVFQDELANGKVHAKAKLYYQAADLDLGQYSNVGYQTRLHYIAGVRYANLSREFDAASATSYPASPLQASSFDAREKNRYEGIGPRIGVSFVHTLGQGFGITGQATGALLVGQRTASDRHTNKMIDDKGAVLWENDEAFSWKNNAIVPNLNAKLGLNYNYQFCNASRTQLNIEAGYGVDHFLNAFNHFEDASIAGPYVNFQVKV